MITIEAISDIGPNQLLSFKLACWVSEQAAIGHVPTITSEAVERIRSYPIPSVKKRAQLYLAKVIDCFEGLLMGTFTCTDRRFQIASWSFEPSDCIAIARYLMGLGAFEKPPGSDPETYLFVLAGHLVYNEIAGKRAEGSQAFVAMWFGAEMDQPYIEAIAPGISGAGYEPLRIDRSQHANKIDDEIIAEIRRSAFVVADFTGHRAGVYYEAGFAHGLGKQVIFTCRAGELTNLHFDVRQYNTIVWAHSDQLRADLQNRLLAVFGAGPLKPDARPISP